MASKKRGIIYMVWGRHSNKKVQDAIQRSMASVQRFHRDWGLTVHDLPAGAGLVDKAKMFETSPYEETLFLDVDTEVMGPLDYGFEMAMRHHIAISICEAPWARRYAKSINTDLVEYNTGVIFFKKSPEAARVFDAWKRLAPITDSSIQHDTGRGVISMPSNDQASFALAVDETGFNPFVLPMNWNFRPDYQGIIFGPVKVWHSYHTVPHIFRAFSDEQHKPGAMLRFAEIPPPHMLS